METPTRISQEDRVFLSVLFSAGLSRPRQMLATSEALGKYLLNQYWINEWDNFKKWVIKSDYIKDKENEEENPVWLFVAIVHLCELRTHIKNVCEPSCVNFNGFKLFTSLVNKPQTSVCQRIRGIIFISFINGL